MSWLLGKDGIYPVLFDAFTILVLVDYNRNVQMHSQ